MIQTVGRNKNYQATLIMMKKWNTSMLKADPGFPNLKRERNLTRVFFGF